MKIPEFNWKRYPLYLVIAGIAGPLTMFGALVIIAENKWLTEKFTDHLWKGLIESQNRGM